MNQTDPTAAVWIDGDPLMEALAAAVRGHCEHSDSGLVIDDPRNIAAVVAAVARAAAPAVVLTDSERQFLDFALDQAAEEMSLGDGFTDEDRAALETLRRLAVEAHGTGTQQQPDTGAPTGCAHRGPHLGFTCAEVDQSRPFWDGWWGETSDVPAPVAQQPAAVHCPCPCYGCTRSSNACAAHDPDDPRCDMAAEQQAAAADGEGAQS